ncbi:MAG TPA: SRPBCC family protein, partial [Acidimicrobiales bacterium]|nr:SRPBCC family protein [Acidimicrobiales bacterium]
TRATRVAVVTSPSRRRRTPMLPEPAHLIAHPGSGRHDDIVGGGRELDGREPEERLEREMEKVYELYIKTTPDRLWEAVTDPEIRAKYQFGAAANSEWTLGAPISLDVAKHGVHLGEGEVLEVDPPRRLVHTVVALWDDDVRAEGTSRVTWEIEAVGDSCHLTVTHDKMREGANAELYGGWPMILSGLKTWLETGELLTTPGSLRYA